MHYPVINILVSQVAIYAHNSLEKLAVVFHTSELLIISFLAYARGFFFF